MKKKRILLMLSLTGLLTFSSPVLTANAAWKNTSSGKIYTQSAAPGYVTGLKKIGSYTYYFNKNGIMMTGLQTVSKKLYYFNADGIMQRGWIRTADKSYYADPKTGVLAVSKWVNNYYFQSDGSMAVSTWIDGKWVGADGRYTGVKNNVGWIKENGKSYYYDSNSKLVKGWLNVGGKTYYMHPTTGVLQKGWITVGGKKYFAGPSQGVIQKKAWVDGKYLKSNGQMATGWTTVGKKTYYFSSSGKRQSGWIKYNKKYYYFSKGVLQKNKWIGSKYAKSDGSRAQGLTKIGKETYYFTSTGTKKASCWVTTGGKRYWLSKYGTVQKKRWLWSKKYYASSSGAVLKGLNKVGKYLYYFNTSTGAKLTSSLKTVSGATYYFQSNGTAATNKWVKIKSKYYYFQSNGRMARNTWVGKYYVNSDGVRSAKKEVTTGWVTTDAKKYYFDSNGNMLTGLQTISGQTYYFSNTGIMMTGIQSIGTKKYYFYSDGKMATSVTLVVGSKQYTINASGVVTAETSIKVTGNTKGAQIVNFALQYVGNPYVYGGTSLTKGADCSGFTYTVFKNFGINLLRVADDQMKGPSASLIKQGYKKAVVVDISSIQAGDLIFYGSGNYASHVGIYMGNGKIVHASNSQPYPAGGIKVSAYNYQTPIKAVRYWS